MNDANLLLSGAGGAVQDIDGALAAGMLSTDWIDLQANSSLNDGHPLFAKVHTQEEAMLSATLNATLEVQIVTFPVLATEIAVASCTAEATFESLTVASGTHGLQRGQALKITDAGAGSGLSTATNYFVREVLSTTAFTLALSPDKDAAVVTLSASTADVDYELLPTIVGSTGGLPIQAFHIDSLISFALNPSAMTDNPVTGRYVYGRFVPSHEVTTGKCLLYIGTDPGCRRIYHPRGSTMPVWAP